MGVINGGLRPGFGGWCVGSEQFRQELLEQMTTLAQSRFADRSGGKFTEKKAERILREELDRRGWDAQQLCGKRKADPEKLRIARRL
jgi:hypothetical protein